MRPQGFPVTDEPPSPAASPRAVRRRRARAGRRKSRIAVAVAMTVLMGMLAAVGYVVLVAYRNYADRNADYPGPGTGSKVVQIAPGATVREMGRTLEKAGVVRSEGAFVAAARHEPEATSIQPGYYRLAEKMKASDALAALLNPAARILARVPVPEGLTVPQTLARLAKATRLPAPDFSAALRDPAALGLPAYAKGNAEGFLFPATYDVEPGATAASVLRQMVDRFHEAALDVGLDEGAKHLRLTPYQVVVVASLVQAEARNPGDFPRVSRVIYNRLAKGMTLSLDSTVHFAVGKSGAVTTSTRDRQVKSPYNTYLYRGLPPGPINSPGQAALDAALQPAAGGWLFFVTVDPSSGLTKFATTEQEHARHVAEFRQWLRRHPS
jgi:UPF0755 protein